MSEVLIPRDQMLNCLRQAGWSYHRETERVELWKKKGSVRRLTVSKLKHFPEALVRVTLGQAGLTPAQVESFLRQSTKH